MKIKTESACRTREEAKAGKRDKPHYFLYHNPSRVFQIAGKIDSLRPIEIFEARIDWSTRGR